MRKVSVTRASIQLTASFRREGSVLQGTMTGACAGFDIHLTLESPAEPAAVKEVVRLAHQSCYTEAALRNPVEVRASATLNGTALE